MKTNKIFLEIIKKNTTGYKGRILHSDAIKMMEEYANQDKWISVNDRLPENADGILLYGDLTVGHFYETGTFSPTFKIFECHAVDGYEGKITHWQPLPEPPKTPE